MANYRQVWRKSWEVLFYREKGGSWGVSYERKFIRGDQGGSGFSLAECVDFSLAEMLLGKEKIFLLPAGVVE